MSTLTIPSIPLSTTPTVLHVRVVTGSGGGPEKTILRSARYAHDAGYRLAAAYIRPRHDAGFERIRHSAAVHGCPLHEIPEQGPVDPRTIHALLRLCRSLRVDVWHGHDYKSNVLGLALKRWHPMRLTTTIHGWTWDTIRARLYHHVDNWCLKRYERIMAVSPLHLEHCARLGIDPRKVIYVPNGIDTDEFRRRSDGGELRREMGVPRGATVVGVVARCSVEKGVDRAVRVMTQLPGCELHVVGDGPERANLQALARSLGVGKRVRFHGWRTDTIRFYEMFDVLLLPSLTEGFPNAALEAMAMGVPVAATDVGAVRELLDDGACGVILGRDDTRAWAGALGRLCSDPAWRSDLSRRALRRVHGRYTFRARMERELAVYDELLGRPALPLRRAA